MRTMAEPVDMALLDSQVRNNVFLVRACFQFYQVIFHNVFYIHIYTRVRVRISWLLKIVFIISNYNVAEVSCCTFTSS